MSNNNRNPISRPLIITTAVAVMLGFGAFSTVQAAPGSVQPNAKPLVLAATEGMERRQDRRDDRQDDRGDRRDTRQDCRDQEGVGKDKRDCKQEGRQERNKDG